jgi:beta-glucanase (GH16 family)
VSARLALVLALAAACGGGPRATSSVTAPAAAPATTPTTTPGAVPGAARDTVFFDDFAGPQLDRARWNVEVTGQWVNNEQQAYVDSPDVLRLAPGSEIAGATNGALVIRAVRRPGFVTGDGKRFDFLSGRINTRGKVEFGSGTTAAARIKMTAGSGLWPAFWILGTGRWPDTGEIDVMEFVGEREWTSVALHGPGYSGDTPLVKRAAFPLGQDATGWHVYAVEWRPDALVFTVDGAEVYRATKADVEHYGPWAFDNPKFLILNLALGGNYPAGVNRVTTPYAGLPQATVDAIARGEATFLVDWVRVTRP